MNMVKTLKIIGKNALVFIAGAALGIMAFVRFLLPYALEKSLAGKEPGAVVAGAIALTPVFLIIYGLMGATAGGFGAVIVYNLVKFILKKKIRKITRDDSITLK